MDDSTRSDVKANANDGLLTKSKVLRLLREKNPNNLRSESLVFAHFGNPHKLSETELAQAIALHHKAAGKEDIPLHQSGKHLDQLLSQIIKSFNPEEDWKEPRDLEEAKGNWGAYDYYQKRYLFLRFRYLENKLDKDVREALGLGNHFYNAGGLRSQYEEEIAREIYDRLPQPHQEPLSPPPPSEGTVHVKLTELEATAPAPPQGAGLSPGDEPRPIETKPERTEGWPITTPNGSPQDTGSRPAPIGVAALPAAAPAGALHDPAPTATAEAPLRERQTEQPVEEAPPVAPTQPEPQIVPSPSLTPAVSPVPPVPPQQLRRRIVLGAAGGAGFQLALAWTQSVPGLYVASTFSKPPLGGLMRIYSDLPFTGQEELMASLRAAIDMAMEEVRDTLGGVVEHVWLDHGVPGGGGYDVARAAQNARLVRNDPHAMAYIGCFNSDATIAASKELQGKAPVMLTLSTANEVTRDAPGAPTGPGGWSVAPHSNWLWQLSPWRLGRYLFGLPMRSVARVLPPDARQGKAAAALAETLGATRVYVLNDTQTYGKALARDVIEAMKGGPTFELANPQNWNKEDDASFPIGISVGWPNPQPTHQQLAAVIADDAQRDIASNPTRYGHLIFWAGIRQNGAAPLVQALDAALSARNIRNRVNFMGGEALTDPQFVRDAGASSDGMSVTMPFLPLDQLGNAGITQGGLWFRRFMDRCQDLMGKYLKEYQKPGFAKGDTSWIRTDFVPTVYVVFAYEAARAALAAIASVGRKDRLAIRDAIFGTRRAAAESVLGEAWGFDPQGDTTLRQMSGMRIRPQMKGGFDTGNAQAFLDPGGMYDEWKEARNGLNDFWGVAMRAAPGSQANRQAWGHIIQMLDDFRERGKGKGAWEERKYRDFGPAIELLQAAHYTYARALEQAGDRANADNHDKTRRTLLEELPIRRGTA